MYETNSTLSVGSTMTVDGVYPLTSGNCSSTKGRVVTIDGYYFSTEANSPAVNTSLSAVGTILVTGTASLSTIVTSEVFLSKIETTWMAFCPVGSLNKETTLTLSGYSVVVEEVIVLDS